MIASRYAEKVIWLKQYLSHLDYDTRESMARLLGIASSSLSISAATELISEVISSFGGTQKLRYVSVSFTFRCSLALFTITSLSLTSCIIRFYRFEAQHGLLCALGYVTANCLLRASPVSYSFFTRKVMDRFVYFPYIECKWISVDMISSSYRS